MKLYKYLLFVIIASLAISGVSSFLMRKGLKRSSVDFFGKMNAAGNEKERTDIFLIGSSRTLVQADPVIIDSITGLSSFNYGLNAITVKSCYNILRYAVLKHPGARLAVFNIDYNMFSPLKDPYKDPFYYAYEPAVPSLLMSDSGVRKQIHRIGIFDICMYDDMAKYAAISGFISPGKKITGMHKGYLLQPQREAFEVPDAANLAKRAAPFSEGGIQILSEATEICERHQIIPVFVIAPYPQEYSPQNYITNFDMIIGRVKALAARKNISLLDYRNIPLTNDLSYFYNVNHLNIKGARIYSTLLANDLKNILFKPAIP